MNVGIALGRLKDSPSGIATHRASSLTYYTAIMSSVELTEVWIGTCSYGMTTSSYGPQLSIVYLRAFQLVGCQYFVDRGHDRDGAPALFEGP